MIHAHAQVIHKESVDLFDLAAIGALFKELYLSNEFSRKTVRRVRG
jgi:hypothetical protein